ncbi:hypothetical protein Nepgr_003547 [Nepenthes gracilis]|uniref:Uncharacterized protein n=1 Tax=Nepenthes gracilis TaxID=150966 RepID=A0AAD3XDS3_NEPGR|nr:hypothetical protein Nepgr_003547 [Nepenthes gracilis]
MGDSQRTRLAERDVGQAITALKKGATLLKYGRRGKPKFCPFRLSNDESLLIWYSGKEEKHLKLNQVSKIIPGQRTAIFQRYPRPEKEYQSFSLIYTDRSLDLICKDKDEAEVWFVGLKSLISNSSWRPWRTEARESSASSDSSNAQKNNQSNLSPDSKDIHHLENPPQAGLGKAFSDIVLYTASSKSLSQVESAVSSLSLPSSNSVENGRSSASDNFRVSLSSAVSSSSQGSCHDDFDSLGDVFIWGEGIGEGVLGGGALRDGNLAGLKMDALLPKALESTMVLDVHHVACGGRHAVLVTRQGEVFSWGEESGGRLGHGAEVDVSHPKFIDTFSGMNVELVACGEYHTCAVTLSGDLFTWGDGTYNSGLLGHWSEASHWVPKKVSGPMEGLHVSYIACGPWHTAAVTSAGQLFTFGDGIFGALGHGDRCSTRIPREVEALRGLRTLRVACGTWHMAAIVEIVMGEASNSEALNRPLSGKLFTWGDGDSGQLGHGDKESRLIPVSVASLLNLSFCKVACGRNLTVSLTTSGQVYTMGSAIYGQLGCPEANGKIPACIEGKIAGSFIEDIACGSHHVAVLTSKSEVYTWGMGTNGQLGHGDNDHQNEPTFVNSLKDKQVKSVVCGSNFTAVICLHKWLSCADNSICTGCHNPFNFRRKRHNCYNCGLVFCKACSSHKSVKSSLAPNMNKPYRVCDDCYIKLKKAMESGSVVQIPRPACKNNIYKSNDMSEKETAASKLAAQVSRIPYSLKRTDSGNSKFEAKVEKVDCHAFPILNGNFLPGSIYSSSGSAPLFGASNKHVSASAPGSRIVSRAASPISQRSSPARSPMPIQSLSVSHIVTHDSKHTNNSLSQEMISLRAQVEKLTRKTQLLESELKKTMKQVKEAKAVAVDEAEKSKAAKEVIKSLTAQLKEMAERVQEADTENSKSDSHHGQTSSILNTGITENHLTSLVSPKSESNIRTFNAILGNGTKVQPEKAEWVVHDEPGVYVTLCSLPGVGNELKRVRFSRKRFTEEQAEKWWAENCTRICERHNIQSK